MKVLLSLLLLLGRARADEGALAVEQALVAAEAKLHRCWEQAAAEDYRVEGVVELRVVVGKPNTVSVLSDKTGKPGLAACAAAVFGDTGFGASFKPGDAVELPVTFKAEPNVTVRAADVKARSGVRALLTAANAGAERVQLSLVESDKPWAGQGVAYVLGGPRAGQVQAGKLNLSGKFLFLSLPAAPKPGAADTAKAPEYVIAGGSGGVKIVYQAPEVYVGRLGMLPGTKVPEHVHDKEAEILWVVDGGGDMTVDGETYPVEPGMAVYVAPGSKHSFTATATVDAIQFYAPGGPEERFKKGPLKR